jgi:hypothetical protein
MSSRILRPNWYDFQKVTREDVIAEQASYLAQVAESGKTAFGTGVRLDFAQEPVLFDSDALTSEQSGWVAVTTFDGRGILATPYASKDADEGFQISVEMTDARLNGFLSSITTIIGKTFDDQLTYEHLVFENNGMMVTHQHFKEVTNIMFQNLRGNSNTGVDGYGSYNVGGRIVVSEASSMKVSPDLIAAEQILEPDIIFRDYKVYDSGKSLQTVITEAIGASNDIDDLDINTTVASTRTFAAGASTETIYAEKFKMQGNNIQKVTLLLALTSGATWSGSIVVGLRPLQTAASCPTDFLPENEIDFDPDTAAVDAIVLDQAALATQGVVLDSTPREVDFIFTGSNLSNPTLSTLVDDQFYALTIQRTGSTTTGTISFEEARNSDTVNQRLTVFQSSIWTDVPDSTLWYRIWSDSVKTASGAAYDQGTQIITPKTVVDNNGVTVQNEVQDLAFINTSEDTENYVIVQNTLAFSDIESHPRTGDLIYSREADAPTFSVLEQTETLALQAVQSDLIVLARARDRNPRSNPAITGTLDYPALAVGNVINVINPGPDLLNQNVVGSIITPNTSKPSLQYRIISQETFTDLYGDTDNDGDIDLVDANRVEALDGYSIYFATTGTYTEAFQETLASSGDLDILELLRAEVDNSDGYEITISDLTAVNAFIDSGTAYPIGASSFTRVRMEVEPLTDPIESLDTDANSILALQTLDPDLIDGSLFSISTNLNFSIAFQAIWSPEHIELLDLRRFTTTTFLDFDAADLQNSPENGGTNNLFVAGDLFLQEDVKNLDGTYHRLDFEANTVEFELPTGDTEGSVNIFEDYVVGQMRFSDNSLVAATALSNNQVRLQVAVGSHVKDVSGIDGYVDFDGYNDGYGANADEVIGTYLDHTTGLLRIRAFNVIENEFFPELRTRILVTVFLKQAGFINSPVSVSSTDTTSALGPIT